MTFLGDKLATQPPILVETLGEGVCVADEGDAQTSVENKRVRRGADIVRSVT